MSLSDRSAQESVESVALWQAPAVDHTAEPVVHARHRENQAESALITAGQLEDVQEKAFAEASSAGWDKGYEDGLAEGRENGYREGYQEGLNSGLEEGREHARQDLESLRQALDLLAEPLNALDDQVEHELVELSMAVARQLVRRELKTDSGQVVSVIREAMQVLPVSSRNVRLYLHPEDAALLKTVLDVDDSASAWELVEDPLLTRGGGRIDTETSRVDATVEKRLAAVIAAALGGERHQDGR